MHTNITDMKLLRNALRALCRHRLPVLVEDRVTDVRNEKHGWTSILLGSHPLDTDLFPLTGRSERFGSFSKRMSIGAKSAQLEY